jgi:hypothetical protein
MFDQLGHLGAPLDEQSVEFDSELRIPGREPARLGPIHEQLIGGVHLAVDLPDVLPDGI